LLYAEDHGSLPPPYLAGPDGKPWHSWRVLILPYIEEKELFDRYRFDEPWDRPNNSVLSKTVPSIFLCPSNAYQFAGTTNYFAVVGPQTAWRAGQGRSLDQFPDGAGQTILLIEAHGRGGNWLAPRDISYREAVQLLSADSVQRAQSVHFLHDHFGFQHAARNVALADGTALNCPIGWTPEAADALLSVAGGEDAASWIARQQRALHPASIYWRMLAFGFVSLLPLPSVLRRGSNRRDVAAIK
jgi:hypothetical protein